MERNTLFVIQWMTGRMWKYKESVDWTTVISRKICIPSFSGRPNRLAGYTCLFLLFTYTCKIAECFSQTFYYQVQNVRFLDVLKVLESKSGYSIFYDQAIVSESPSVSVDLKNADLSQVLEAVLKNRSLTYNIQGKTIFLYGLSEEENGPVTMELDPINIKGIVSGEDGKHMMVMNV